MEKVWVKHYDKGVPATIQYPETTLHRLLEDTAKRFPDSTAIIFPGALGDAYKVDYRRLEDDANRMANALASLGVKKGDRVALIMPNCPQFVIAYYGALKLGAIVVAFNPLYSPREIEHQLNDCEARVIIALSMFYKNVAEVRSRTKLEHVVVTYIKEYLPPVSRLLFSLLKEKKEGHRPAIGKVQNTHLFQDLLKKYEPKPPAVDVKPDDIALFQYTGGTTGVSKGVVATHRNVLSNTMQIKAWATAVGIASGKDVVMGVMPLFHAYGMVTVMHFCVLEGLAMILLPRFVTEQVLKAINKFKPVFFPGVPTMYVAINNYPKVKKYDLKSVKACVSGAAPLPVEVQQKFEQLSGGKLVEGYGLSEAPVVVTCNPVMGKRKVGSIGVPVPDVDAKIVDLEKGEKEMPVGEIGELIVKGPQVMKGYWNRPEETSMVLRNGWLYTGDIAKMDEDGFFFIVDRKKEMIIAGGYNIYPREVEEVLYEHEKIKEAACYGVPDEYRGETVKVAVVLKEGQTCTPEEITEYCKTKLAKYKVPKKIEFRTELPKSPIGKVLRRVLVEEEKKKQQTGGGG
ncbi:MAG: long-chain fatty acid--CoA ligase [Dehalococcoidia bacterium]|nr:long-chain fatty acid--CoA ligase [Dehalococcoidia bacterium]